MGKDRLVHVTGAGVTAAGKLWDRVFDLVGTPMTQRTTKGTTFEAASVASTIPPLKRHPERLVCLSESCS